MSSDKTKKVDLAGAQALVQDTIRRFKTECVILDNSGDIIISSDSSFASGTSGSTKTKDPTTQYEKLLIHIDGSLWVKTGTDSSGGEDKTIWTCRGRVHVAPTSTEVKGALGTGSAVSSQTQSTRFLREDGSWAAPSYTANDGNTTYSLGVGTGADANKVVLTPSSGTANKITVPYATAAGNAATVNDKTVGKNVPADAVFTDTHHDGSVTADSGYALTKVAVGSNGTWSKEQVVIPAAQIQSDWNQTSITAKDYIKNKPTIPTIPASLPARNQIANYTTISANQSNVTTSLTEDGSEAKVYYNSGSSAVTVSFASSGLTFVDGNDNMEIPAGGVGEVNFLRVTTSGTTRVFVRSATSDDSVTVNTVS